MPLNAPGDGIDIPFTSSADDLIAESNRVISQLDKVKQAVKAEGAELERQAKMQEAAFQKTRISITDFRSAYQIAMDVVRVGKQVWNETGDAVVRYGDQVQKIKTITGQSAELASRQIQLADDLRVSYEKLSISLQYASKKGIDTSIEGLIALGDEYKKLPKGIEQTQFLMEKFGKSGLDMNKILSQTEDTIRDLAASTPDGLILSDKDLEDIAEYNRNLDTMQDNFTALKMSAGKDAIPIVARAFGELNKNIEESGTGLGILRFGFDDIFRAVTGTGGRLNDASKAIQDTSDAAEENADATDDMVDSQKEAEEQAKKLSNAYTGLLSSMFSINKQNEDYQKTVADIASKDDELAAKKNQLTLKMWEEQKAGKLTNDEYLRYVQQLDDVTKAQEENTKKREDAAKENKDASNQRVYDLAKERLAADGLIDSGEYKFLQDLAVQRGLVSRAAADQAIAESQAADQIVAGFAQTNPAMQQSLALMHELYAFNGKFVNFGVNFINNMPSMVGNTFGSNGINYSQSFKKGTSAPLSVPMASRDSGGSGIAGTPYKIGVEEVFVPHTGGEFVPLGGANKGQLGNVYNIIVNNPKKETTENSIRSALISLSYLGRAK